MSSPYVPVPGKASYRVPRAPTAWSWSGVLPVVVRGLIAILVLLAAQLVAGTYLHDVQGVGLAAGIVSLAPVWFVVIPLALMVAAWLAWRWWPGMFLRTVVVIAALTAIASGVIVGRMVYAVQDAGVKLNVGQLFQLSALDEGKPDDRQVYLTRDGASLGVDIYRPAKTASKAPILLYIHGGGWSKGGAGDRSVDFQWFADRGFLVLSVEYSLSTSTKHLWDVTQSEVGCALSWVTKNASKYGGDPRRLSLAGDSAGGTLAINTAYLQAAGDLPSACGGKAPTVDAVSVAYPVVDVRASHNLSPVGADYVRDYIGGSPEEFPERYSAVSSITKITEGAPPTTILTGESDHLVPVESVVRFADKARAAGIETKLVRVPYAEHGFDIFDGGLGDQAYRQLTLNWLTKHGQKP